MPTTLVPRRAAAVRRRLVNPLNPLRILNAEPNAEVASPCLSAHIFASNELGVTVYTVHLQYG